MFLFMEFMHGGKKIVLTQNQVEEIVRDWYLLGMFSDILMNEDGMELEELLTDTEELKIKIKEIKV